MKGFKQIVEEPTRITEKSKSLIDHVFMDMEKKLNYHIENLKIDYGDHNILVLTLANNQNNIIKQSKIYNQRVYKKDKEEYYVEYINKEMERILEDSINKKDMEVEEKFDRFIKVIKNGNDIYFPFKERKIKNKEEQKIKWFNKELRRLRKEKDRKYKIWSETKLYIDKLVFKKSQKQFKEKLKEAENNYYKKCIETFNSKEKWKTINKLLGRKERPREIEIYDKEGKKLSQMETANAFNSYFIESGNVLNETDKESKKELNMYNNSKRYDIKDTFMYKEVNEGKIEEIISQLKENKATNDDYAIYSIKLVKKQVAKVLSQIINESIMKGRFPKALKRSTIIPIYKNGDRNEVNNYRPITLTSVFHKIFEKVVLEQIWDYINKYNIINDYQYGFRKGHNTIHAIIVFINNIYMKIKKEKVIGLFLDLRKAYDSISHEILLDKLYDYGLRGIIGRWLGDYLINRTQEVRIGDTKSNKKIIKRGIPQGSTLGCLLFCLYINDIIGDEIEGKNMTIFADDTNILVWDQNDDIAASKMNNELERLKDWLNKNEMALNVGKTKYIKFGSSNLSNIDQESNIRVSEVMIERVKDINFLGVTIDHNLSFKLHIKKVINRLRATIAYCYKIRHKLDNRGRKMLYYGIIYPIMTYGIEVYSNTSWTNLKIIDSLHKKIIKILFVLPKIMATKELYATLGLLDLRHIIMLQLVKIGNKWAQNKLPNKLECLFEEQILVKTRQSKNIYKKSLSTYKEQRIIDYRVGRYWNVLPRDIKELKGRNFDIKVKEYYLKQMYDTVKGENINRYY